MENEYIIDLKQRLYEEQYDNQFIERCCEYSERLLLKGLPVFFDEEHIDCVLHTHGMPALYDYHSFELINGSKIRKIYAPSKRLKKRQQWILCKVLNNIKISESVHGFEKGHSIKTHAELHAAHSHVVCMDIKNFFPSVTSERVAEMFNNLGYTVRASRGLARLCCYNGVLPQGAPTSPKIANIICRDMDIKIQNYSEKRGITYSRYADDLTFSANVEMPELVGAVTEIVKGFGFNINQDKTRIYAPGEPKFITGLVVQNGTVRIPKGFKRELKKEIYYCQKFGVLIHLQNTNSEHYINYREHLYGKAYYINMIEPEAGKSFLDELDRIQWPEYML